MDMVSWLIGYEEGLSSGGSGGTVEGIHYVTFMSEDGRKELYKRPVADGDNCADVVARGLLATPTKESTAQYSYSYSGWSTAPGGAASSSALNAVTEDRTVYAAFTASVRYYTVSWYNGDTLLQSTSVAYGTTPSYSGSTPAYGGDEPENWKFTGWSPAVAPVTGDAVYTAEFEYVNLQYAKLLEGTITSYASDVPTEIGVNAFQHCNALETVYCPNVVTINNLALSGCAALKTVNFPAATIIGQQAFQACSLLESANIPAATKVDYNAFNDCPKLLSIDLPVATTFGNQTFRRCSALKTVNIPKAPSVVNSMFYECTALEMVSFPAATSVEANGFYGCSKLTSVNVHAATKIGNYAFQKCTALKRLDLPVATSVGTNFASGCTVLDTLILRSASKTCSISSTASLSGTPIASKTGYIYVPSARLSGYTGNTMWSNYKTQFRAIEDYPDIVGGTA